MSRSRSLSLPDGAGAPVAICLIATCLIAAAPALAETADATTGERLRRGAEVVQSLNGGTPQPALEALRAEFPFLADATQGYALGEVWARPQLDPRVRQLATVSAFAALGHLPELKIHAGYALNLGVTEDELKEVVYLTTVHAGFPRALAAARTLSELYAERRQETGQ